MHNFENVRNNKLVNHQTSSCPMILIISAEAARESCLCIFVSFEC